MANINIVPAKGQDQQQESSNQRVIIVQQPTPEPSSVTTWEYVAKIVNSGAFAVLVSWCVVGFLIWRGVKDAIAKHLRLMETLTLTTRTNSQVLETNAASLRRLSLSNARVARILERSNYSDTDAQRVAEELQNTLRVLDISAGMLQECQSGSHEGKPKETEDIEDYSEE
ncbi:hypothetical protein [Floridanema aerugineum]|uniref:Uncharacterized protein n=1 Tax=Floridaenema aerugineum BLCC-F46 TaxID=3153654 RepID=A0ABV4X260_9CYAN